MKCGNGMIEFLKSNETVSRKRIVNNNNKNDKNRNN